MLRVYKATAPGMKARLGNGKDHPHMGLNVTTEANCAQNGWHCAENPLDCLSYFSWDDKNEFYLCEAGGDIHESGHLSVVSCTELTVKKRLTLVEFVAEAVKYIIRHPNRALHSQIKAIADIKKNDSFAIVCGENISASGEEGCVLAWIQKDKSGCILAVHIEQVGLHNKVKPGISYSVNDMGFLFADRRNINET